MYYKVKHTLLPTNVWTIECYTNVYVLQINTSWQWTSTMVYIATKHFPNTLRRESEHLSMNSSAICWQSTAPSLSLWTWHAMTWFTRFCVIVERSHVLIRRRALNDLSASHELAGETKSKRSSLSTCGNIRLTEGSIALNINLCPSSVDEEWWFL